MAQLPAPRSLTVEAIYSWWENKLDRLSRRLGASQIGRECERELWYSFRWCFASSGSRFDGRMKRLSNRGHREEAVFTEELRGIGCTVHDIDPSTGQQFEFTACGGHFVAKIDGVALGVPEAPKTWHVLSYKTSNEKGFTELAGKKDDREKGVAVPKGVETAKPEHYAQNQIEMRLAQLDRTLYLSVDKDTDEIHGERIRYDEAAATRLEAKAERVIYAPEPLQRISEDAAFWKCKGGASGKGKCAFYDTCHGTALPRPSCRTCLHATPEKDGDGRWSCALAGKDEAIPLDVQQEGCSSHLFIPALLTKWGEAVDASETEGWVQYRAADGYEFRNGPWGERSFTSKELHASTPALLRDVEFQALRTRYAGTVTERAKFDAEAA